MPPASEPLQRRPVDRRPSAWIVGITGGIGSGKSTVAAAFGRLGGRVIDADKIARKITQKPEVLEEIADRFGPDLIGLDGQLDRERTAERIFGDEDLRRQFEAIVHPRVRTKIDKELAKWHARGSDGASPLPGNRPLIILDIPLLERSPYIHQVSAVVFVDSPLSARIERVQRTRGWSEDELTRREASQVPVSEKRDGADHIVLNEQCDATRGSKQNAGQSERDSAVRALEEQCRTLIALWSEKRHS